MRQSRLAEQSAFDALYEAEIQGAGTEITRVLGDKVYSVHMVLILLPTEGIQY